MKSNFYLLNISHDTFIGAFEYVLHFFSCHIACIKSLIIYPFNNNIIYNMSKILNVVLCSFERKNNIVDCIGLMNSMVYVINIRDVIV